MSRQGDKTIHGKGQKQAFVSALHTLKQQGCSLLVVGTAPNFVYKSVCREMLGDSKVSPRRRLFVATDREVSTACTLLSTTDQQLDPTSVKILSFTSAARSAVPQTASPPSQIPFEQVPGSTLSDLGIAISEAIAEFDAQESGLSPAELRVCLDSLTPLVDYDRDTLFLFLDLLNGRIRRVAGMGHMHLPVERDSELVHFLEPLFDAVVELRVKSNEPQQRWHLRKADISSGWISQG